MKLNIISDLHKHQKRCYLGRMINDKPDCMVVARKFEKEFFDGARCYGYGGYVYDGRWIPIAKKLIDQYSLTKDSRILDIGCGMGHLLYEIDKLIKCSVSGCEISDYALNNMLVRNKFKFDFNKDKLKDNYDLILCINTLHNLILPNLKTALQTISDHAKQSYIVVESYRNEQELFNLQCWSLTAEQFLRPEEWEFLFTEWGYHGSYEFIYF